VTPRGACLATALLGLALANAACGGGAGENAQPRTTSGVGPPAAQPPPAAEQPSEPASPEQPLAEETVTLYFPSSESDGLVSETRQILHTSVPGDRAKQIISDLIAGPSSGSGVSPVPEGTRLRQIYVLDDGTAYADFSEELRAGMEGGSDAEILTVYSIVNSLALNLTEIRRVAILVEGRECETLNGHLDLRRPLRPDPKLVVGEEPAATPPDDASVVRRAAARSEPEV